MNQLGRLVRVQLREVWQSEATSFTPWLAQTENLALLGETIGIELELEAQEKDVGPFRADLLCKDTAEDRWVLVENQLERTDHTHLGQLLTYAAGLKAVSIVWVASRFTDEHRATLDWLNEITDDQFNFFGLEIEAWRIGDSPAAPKFNVISKPNDWTRSIAKEAKRVEMADLTGAKQLQLEFWTAFKAFTETRETRFRTTKPRPQHWMNIALGRSGVKLAAIASTWNSVSETFGPHELRAEVVMHDENAKVFFALLSNDRDAIEQEFGGRLTWHSQEDTRMCRIYARTDVDLDDRDHWNEYCRWLSEKLDAMHKVFSSRVKSLDPDQSAESAMP